MVSTVLLEGQRTAEFLVSEAENARSRDVGVMNNGTGADIAYPAGLVVQQQAVAPAVTKAGPVGTGNGTMGTVTVGPNARIGAYKVKFTSATAFDVTDPRGYKIDSGTTGVAYSNNELGFTITAGGTAFVSGDSFTVTVGTGDASWAPLTSSNLANDAPLGVLFDNIVVPASGSKRVTVICRSAELNGGELKYDASLNTGNITTAINALKTPQNGGLVVR